MEYVCKYQTPTYRKYNLNIGIIKICNMNSNKKKIKKI